LTAQRAEISSKKRKVLVHAQNAGVETKMGWCTPYIPVVYFHIISQLNITVFLTNLHSFCLVKGQESSATTNQQRPDAPSCLAAVEDAT